jgi:copper chaperone
MTRTFKVEGMSCGHCKQSVEGRLSEVPGIVAVEADPDAGTVRVDGEADDATISAAVEDAGYQFAGAV